MQRIWWQLSMLKEIKKSVCGVFPSICRRLWDTHLKFSFKPEMTAVILEPRIFLACSKKNDKLNVAYSIWNSITYGSGKSHFLHSSNHIYHYCSKLELFRAVTIEQYVLQHFSGVERWVRIASFSVFCTIWHIFTRKWQISSS